MALIIDPDNLNQGALTTTGASTVTFSGAAGVTVTINGSADLPALAAGDFFEVRDALTAANNGLYVESGGTPTTSAITADKVSGANPANDAVGQQIRTFGNTTTEKSVHYDVDAKGVYLIEQGLLSVDGVTEQALYSFTKEEWKADTDLIAYPFPMIAITPEQFEFVDAWNPVDDAGNSIRSRKLIRTGGWSEVAVDGTLLAQYTGVVTLGSFEDETPVTGDLAYYQLGDDPTDTTSTIDFDFTGPVNEAIQVYKGEVLGPFAVATEGFDITLDTPSAGIDRLTLNGTGSFLTEGFRVGSGITIRNATTAGNDGQYQISAVTATTMDLIAVGGGDPGLTAETDDNTMTVSVDDRIAVKLFLRVRDADPNGKTFDQSDLAGIGFSAVDNKVFRFPLANATDLKIAETDANIDGNSPYTQMAIRYFDQAFNREVDSATNRDFGIVIDVGTHSGVDGSFSAAGAVLTTTEGGITGANYTGGTLRIHEGTDENTVFSISGTPTATTVTITTTFTATESNISFTLQRATPIVATAEEIYEFVQRQLRRAADVDSTDQIVTGETADELLRFVGDSLECGQGLPVNPNGGGSGVIIEGFDSNDTNRLSFFDNTGVARTFPFVAAGTISFNNNLVNDTGPAEYFMYFRFTEQFTNTGFSLTGATGDTATLNSSTTDLVAELANGDYINLTGFANEENNGVWVLTGAPAGTGPWTAGMRKLDGQTVVNEGAGPSVSLDKNPVGSPDAILVDNNAGADITGNIGASSIAFDYDYDNNVQGGRTAATDAEIRIVALGLDLGAFVEVDGTITRATGLSFSVVAPLERNYSNP